MYSGKKIVCIIAARGGSAGLPGKNIMPIGGKPMIAHAIEKARYNRFIDRVIVSTDSQEIAKVAEDWGAEIPFLRDPSLAQSTTPMPPVIIDVLDRLNAIGSRFDVAVMLQANSPLLAATDIDRVISDLIDRDMDVVFTVCEAGHPPQWSIRLREGTPSFAFIDETSTIGERRQEQETLYRSTGAIYAVRVPFLYQHGNNVRLCLPMAEQRSGVVVTDPLSAVDIDTELDFLVAEALFTRRSHLT